MAMAVSRSRTAARSASGHNSAKENPVERLDAGAGGTVPLLASTGSRPTNSLAVKGVCPEIVANRGSVLNRGVPGGSVLGPSVRLAASCAKLAEGLSDCLVRDDGGVVGLRDASSSNVDRSALGPDSGSAGIDLGLPGVDNAANAEAG